MREIGRGREGENEGENECENEVEQGRDMWRRIDRDIGTG